MDTETLTDFMTRDLKTRRFFKGVFPRNLLPSQLESESLYVINLSAVTDTSEKEQGGSHWVLLSTLSSPYYSAYICSLGQKPTHKNIIDSLFSVSDCIVYSNFKNQGDLTTVCGYHVVWTGAMLSRGHNLLDIMTSFFTESTYINDHAVVEIISTNFNIQELIPISDWKFILTGQGVTNGCERKKFCKKKK